MFKDSENFLVPAMSAELAGLNPYGSVDELRVNEGFLGSEDGLFAMRAIIAANITVLGIFWVLILLLG